MLRHLNTRAFHNVSEVTLISVAIKMKENCARNLYHKKKKILQDTYIVKKIINVWSPNKALGKTGVDNASYTFSFG